MLDSSYPWFILVPDRDDITEIFQLDIADQQQLIAESSILSSAISHQFNADKINVAALGNLVPQLHIHHIARYTTDPAWPAPVWGKHASRPYSAEEANRVIDKITRALGPDSGFIPTQVRD